MPETVLPPKGYSGYVDPTRRIPMSTKPGGKNADVKFQTAGPRANHTPEDTMRVPSGTSVTGSMSMKLTKDCFKRPEPAGTAAKEARAAQKERRFIARTSHQDDFAMRPALTAGRKVHENLLLAQSTWKKNAVKTRTNGSTYKQHFTKGPREVDHLIRGTTKGSMHTSGYGGHIPAYGTKGLGERERRAPTNILDTFQTAIKGYTGKKLARRN